MKRVVGLVVLAVLAPMVQSAVAPYVPQGWLPDLSFLLVVAIGLVWRSAPGGLVVAGAAGFAVDLLSGSLLGQHVLLRVLAFGAARVTRVHVNLAGVLPQLGFAASLTIANALALGALTAFFSAGGAGAWPEPGALLPQALVNALTLPFVSAFVSALIARLGDEAAGRRLLRLEPRSWSQ